MNLTHDLEQFHNGLTEALQQLELLQTNYPEMFKEVLPEGEDIRLEDALTALQNAEDETAKSLDLVGTDLEVD